MEWDKFVEKFDDDFNGEYEGKEADATTTLRIPMKYKALIERAIEERREFNITTHTDHDGYLRIKKDDEFDDTFELRVYNDGILSGAVGIVDGDMPNNIEWVI